MEFIKYSDWELVKKYECDSCDRAFKEILNRYKSKIYTTIYYIIKDHYISEDIFQETFIKVAKNIKEGKYKEEGKLGPWIGRIAHNLCIDHIRKSKSSIAIKFSNNEYNDLENILVSQVGMSTLETEQTHSILWQLMLRLPQEQLEVIVLRIYADMSFRQISQLMQVSINTSLGRMRYGLMNLRKMIEAEKVMIR